MKYLLSTGNLTDKVEKYIIDLFKLNLSIWPGDIPGDSGVGFDFILTDTKKDELTIEVRSRAEALVSKIQNQFSSGITIGISDIEIIDSERVRITLDVNQTSESIEVKIYENE